MYDNMSFNEDKTNGSRDQSETNGKASDTGVKKNVDETELGLNGHIKPDKVELMNMTIDSDFTNAGGVTVQQGRVKQHILHIPVFILHFSVGGFIL